MKYPKYKRTQISKSVTLKSGLEEVIYNYLTTNNVKFIYEGKKITYSMPEQKKTYSVDFPCDNILIETKGAFNSQDRKKHRLIKNQHPELDLRFIFSNSKNKIGKKSQTTYGKWCELFGFKYHCIATTKKSFPEDWLQEIQNAKK